jgi:hypothetical protein
MQHDYAIANQGFPAFRSDLNDALAAIVSNNSGATEPTTMFAHQIWVDTAANPSVLKIRNADNDAWITIGTINQTGDTFTLTSAVSATTLNTSGAVVFNDAGADVDFRVEGDTNANLLFVDAGNDRVGVGTGSPTAALSVFKAGTTFPNTNFKYNLQVSEGSLNNYQTGGILFGSGAESIDPFYYGAIYYNGPAGTFDIINQDGLNDGGIAFKTRGSGAGNAVERMRIDYLGNVLVGYTTSNGSYKLQVNSQIFATNATIATSDGRYKEDIQSLDGALNLVTQLNPVQFCWKEHPVHNFDRSGPTVGFIAQEVQQVLADKPYLNSIIKTNECTIEPAEYETVAIEPAIEEVKDEEGNVITEAKSAVTEQRLIKEAITEEFLGIAEGNMIALLTKAIQELKAINDAQAQRIETLEAKVAALEGN